MRKIVGLFFLCLIVVSSFTGCATAYQAEGITGGFNDTRIDENMFIVTFKGNGYTGLIKSTDFALLRCGEVCKENGFLYFKIIDDKADKSTDKAFWGHNSFDTSKPSNRNTIICFKDKPEGISYNAEYIVKGLKEKYRIK